MHFKSCLAKPCPVSVSFHIFFILRIRPSFREGPRSPTHRRSLIERRSSLGAVEEDALLARKEQEYEKKMETLRSRK